MRVDTVDNTNFRMALKLNPDKMPAKLREMSMENIIRLNQLGEKIKDIKLYDVVFEDSFVPQVKSADASVKKDFFKEFKKEEEYLGKACEIPCGMSGETAGGFFPDEPKIFREIYKEDASKEYKEFKKLHQIDQAGELSRLLEKKDVMINKAKQESDAKLKAYIEKQKKEIYNTAFDEKVSKYEFVTQEAEKVNEKSWWKSIFG